MKRILYILLLFFIIDTNAQQLEYFKKISTTATNLDVRDMKTDKLGNTFVVLVHKGSLTIGSQTIACNNTYGNFVLLKFDSSGNLLWTKMDGMGNYELGTFQRRNSILIDNSNNIYLIGNLYDSAIFSGYKIQGGKDIDDFNYFIVKFSNDGQYIWSKSYGGFDCFDLIENIIVLNDNGLYLIGEYGGSLGDSTVIGNYNLKLPNNQGSNEYFLRLDSSGNIMALTECKLLKPASFYSYPFIKYLTQIGNNIFLTGENIGIVVYGNDTINSNLNGCGVYLKINLTTNTFIAAKKHYNYPLSSTSANDENLYQDDNSFIELTENNGRVNYANGVSVFCPFPSSTGLTHSIVSKINKQLNTTVFAKGLNYLEQKGFLVNGKYISINVDNPPLPIDNIILNNKGGLDIYIMEMDSNYALQKYKSIASSAGDYMPVGTSKNNFIYGLVVSNGTGALNAFDSVITKTASVNYYIFKAKILSPPLAPINLTATHTGSNNVKLQWTDKSSDETKFRIYRSNVSTGPFTLIDSVGSNITLYNHLNSNAGLQYYQVCAVNSEGQNCSNITSVSLGISNNSQGLSTFKVYPNPFKSEIQVHSLQNAEIKEIIIFNLLGESIINQKEINKNSVNIDTENLQSGVYFLKIITDDNQGIIYKIVK